jgi:hypothetical protein
MRIFRITDGVLDGGHHTHVTATPRTGQHVYGEGFPLEALALPAQPATLWR